jgi:uncharacterized protein
MDKDEILSTLRDFKVQNAAKYGILSLGVFGSVARGEMREDSDIDLFVTTQTANPFNLVHAKEEIEQRLHRHVDIVRVRERMNPFLRDRIEREGISV